MDYAPRPVPLAQVPRAYGLLVVGSSIWPEYREGDPALIHPHLPHVGGEVYVFYAEKEGEARASIKLLRRASPSEWLVSQHNPARDFSLPRAEW